MFSSCEEVFSYIWHGEWICFSFPVENHDERFGVPSLEELGFDCDNLKPTVWPGGETEALSRWGRQPSMFLDVFPPCEEYCACFFNPYWVYGKLVGKYFAAQFYILTQFLYYSEVYVWAHKHGNAYEIIFSLFHNTPMFTSTRSYAFI